MAPKKVESQTPKRTFPEATDLTSIGFVTESVCIRNRNKFANPTSKSPMCSQRVLSFVSVGYNFQHVFKHGNVPLGPIHLGQFPLGPVLLGPISTWASSTWARST